MVIIIGDNFFDGLQVVFGTMLVWSEVGQGNCFPDIWPKCCFVLGKLVIPRALAAEMEHISPLRFSKKEDPDH